MEDKPLMARHCFIVNSIGEAIDPTLFCFKYNDYERDYFSFFMYDNVSKYLKAVENNDFMPDLIKPLKEIEKVTSRPWAEENNYFLIE
jgi:hypothetical protein